MDEGRRRVAINRLYELLRRAESVAGGRAQLAHALPLQRRTAGVYFFMELGEVREDGATLRVTRVGTHGLAEGGRQDLHGRLVQHRGTLSGRNPGGGNHRGSVFRRHVGGALIARGDVADPGSWGKGGSASAEIRAAEGPVERAVSEVIRAMPLVWVPIEDRGDRAAVERGAVALLSNHERPPIDPASSSWLGRWARAPLVRASGLWNDHFSDDAAEDGFLEPLAGWIERWEVSRP